MKKELTSKKTSSVKTGRAKSVNKKFVFEGQLSSVNSSEKNIIVTDEKLDKYFATTRKALDIVKASDKDEKRIDVANDLLGMAESYFSDAQHFRSKGDYVLAFAAVNYAHAWLDAGARLKVFKVSDSELFAAD